MLCRQWYQVLSVRAQRQSRKQRENELESFSMDREPSPLRAFSVASAVALILFGAWRSWKAYQETQAERDGVRRDKLMWRIDSLYPAEVDSFCKRGYPDSLVHRDGLAWYASRTGLPLRVRGREDGWDWGCYGTPDSGLVIFLALDSGCATGGQGGLWNHSCRVQRQTWDLVRKTGSGTHSSSHSRSLWTFPGDDKICPALRRPDPLPDSIGLERCR